ncbi:unnamed protein product [Adineta steineri]|uniref:Protein SEC13 homolog n=1 Tax=Adineta steineri TaxID=433720 RepID=A0A815QW05_9BILA|nr:unnamed protein product [Adineta steineri]
MTQINAIDTGHEEIIHDAQLDYYGIRLATCSSDKSIKIFDVSNSQQRLIAELKGHEGPVWQLSWSHPTFGSLLASCSYDRKVLIWKETTPTGLPPQSNPTGATQYSVIYEHERHTSSVNTVAWAPYEYGLMLACGSSDGSISILSSTGDGKWTTRKVPDCHPPGVNALSWAPAVLPQSSDDAGVQGTTGEPVKRFVSGGCDCLIRIWKEQDDGWVEETHLDQHNDWVRDVAWAPTFSFHKDKIASCSQDGNVYVFTRDTRLSNNWECITIGTHFNDVWSVSWSLTGDILAVAAADKVSLWKLGLDGKYQCLTTPQTSSTSTGSPSVNSTMESTTGESGNIPVMAT